MLKISCFDITQLDKEEYSRFYEICSNDRKEKVNRYYHIEDKLQSICAEILIYYALNTCGKNWKEKYIYYNEYGKPFVKNTKDFHFNLSHSGKWIVIAYGKTEMGIDIERIKADKTNIADAFFLEKERNYINESPIGKDKRFCRIWTLKESYIKYLGSGLTTELTAFCIGIERTEKEKIIVTTENGKSQEELYFKSDLFDEDYYLSVCSEENEISIEVLEKEELFALF